MEDLDDLPEHPDMKMGEHLSPVSTMQSYSGGFDRVKTCSKCGFTMLASYWSDISPCRMCGENYANRVVAKWISTSKWWNPMTWGSGYWADKSGKRV